MLLGFRVTGSWPAANPVWCMLERDGARVMFMANEHLGEPPVTGTLYIETHRRAWASITPDFCSGRDSVGAGGLPVGMHEFAIKDCNGYTISFGQPVSPDDESHEQGTHS